MSETDTINRGVANNISVSAIVPAYNEEDNLRETIDVIIKNVYSRPIDYEIIIVNDCSTDATGRIADELAAGNPNIKVVHNERNMGLGYNMIKGYSIAKNDYAFYLPGDNQTPDEYLKRLFDHTGKEDVDMIIPYATNPHIRPFIRRLISSAFTSLFNILFGLDLRYYNGLVVFKNSVIRSIDIKTHSFAFQAESVTKLVRTGHSYIEIPIYIQERSAGRTKAFRIRNVIQVVEAIIRLFWEINIAQRSKYNAPVRCLGVVEPETER